MAGIATCSRDCKFYHNFGGILSLCTVLVGNNMGYPYNLNRSTPGSSCQARLNEEALAECSRDSKRVKISSTLEADVYEVIEKRSEEG